MPRSTAVTCDECGKQIARKNDLKRHKILHSPDKEALKISCPFTGCRYKTLQRSNLDNHLNTHTGSRPYKCVEDGCKFRASDRGSLTRHRKEIHGYVPKRRARARTIHAKEAEKLSTPPPTAGESMLSIEALLDLCKTPPPELMQMLGPDPLSVPPTDCYTNTSISTSGSAVSPLDYFTEYFGTHDLQQPILNTQSSSSSSPSLLASGLLMSEEARMWDNKELLSNFFDTPLPTLPPPPNAVENNSTPSAGLYVDDPNYAIYNTSAASGSQFPGDYYPSTSIPFGCEPTVNTQSFNPQAFGNYPFTAPEMGFHYQDLNQTYPYIMPVLPGGYPMQGTTYPSDQSPPFHS